MIAFSFVICILISLKSTDAIPLLESERSIPSEDGQSNFNMANCPVIGSIMSLTLKADEISDLGSVYNYDGVVFHDDDKEAGYLAVGCQRSSFITDLYGKNAGTCSFELLLIEPDDTFIGTLIAVGSAIFDENGISARVTITGGDGCLLGKIGHIDIGHNRLNTYFMHLGLSSNT